MVLILERIRKLAEVIMCFWSITSMPVLYQVDCLDLETLEKFEANNKSFQDKLGESIDKTTSRLGALQCIAKSLPKLPTEASAPFEPEHVSLEEQKLSESERNESKLSNKEPNQPQVILLPPFEGGDDDKHDETQSVEEEHTQPPIREVVDDSAEDDNQEQEQTDEQAESTESNDRQSKAPSRGGTHKNWSRRKTIWDHFKRPLDKLHKGNSTRRINTRNSKYTLPRRFKRQASNFPSSSVDGLDSNSLVNIIVRALTGTTSTLTDNTLQGANTVDAARNLMQQVLASITLIAQQLISALVRQTAADIPRHASNLGQLFANLLTVLTIQNPLIINSPLLERSNGTSESARAREQIDSFERTLRLIRELARESMRTALNLSASMMMTPQNSIASAASSAAPVNLANDSRASSLTKDDNQEGKLIGRIMGLTSENFKNDTLVSKYSNQKSRANRRVKRSLGTLLLFGPFSKFYMAMMLNRVIKYQSSVLSQAIIGELVRRFIVPSVSSSLVPTTAGVTNFLNQVKHSFGNTVQASADSNQILQAAKMSVQSPIKSDDKNIVDKMKKLHKNNFEEKRSARPVVFDADCRLADPGGLKFYQDLVKNSLDPKQLLLNFAALNRSAISIDQKGMIIDTPHSKVTIPSLQTSQQALIRLIKGSNEPNNDFPGNAEDHLSYLRAQELTPPHHQPVELFKTNQQHSDSHTFHLNHTSPLKGSSRVTQSPYDFGIDSTFNEQAALSFFSNQSDQQSKLLQPPKILSGSLSNATSTQLLDILGQINSQQQQKPRMTDEQLFQQLQFINLLSNLTLPNSSIHTTGNDRPSMALKWISTENKEPVFQNMSPPTSADSIAEKILNKTLETSLANLIQASNSASGTADSINNNKLIRDTSDLLVNSFAHIIKGLDFNANATKNVSKLPDYMENTAKHEINSKQKSPIQITLTTENAATLIDELASSKKKVNENSIEISNAPMPLVTETDESNQGKLVGFSNLPPAESSQVQDGNIGLREKEIERPVELPPQTERELQQVLREESLQNSAPIREPTEPNSRIPVQLDLPVEPKLVETNQQILAPIDTPSMGIEFSDGITNDRQNIIPQNETHLVALGSSRSQHIQTNRVISTTKSYPIQPNSTQFYPGYVQDFAKQPMQELPKTPLLLIEQTKQIVHQHSGKPRQFPLREEKFLRTDIVGSHHVKRPQAVPKTKSELVELKSPVISPIPNLPERSKNYERLAKDKVKHKIKPEGPARQAQASTTIHRVSTELSSQSLNANQTQQQQRENLNNIAMALNVMNMVLLNQKLAGNFSYKSPKLATTSSPRLKKQREKSKNGLRQKNGHKALSNSTSSNPKDTNITTRTSDLERENITKQSNHRTPSNRIKLNSKLLVANGKQNISDAIAIKSKSGRYSFQPLIVNSSSIGVGTNSSELNNSGATESDVEHANRWNDVLAHLNLAAS